MEKVNNMEQINERVETYSCVGGYTEFTILI